MPSLFSSTSYPIAAGPVQHFLFVTSGTSVTVPSTWNTTNNKVEAIGSGGDGTAGSGVVNSVSGGGGAYCFINNVPSSKIQAGDVLTCSIGVHNGTTQTTLNDRTSTLLLAADFGAPGFISGAGGLAANNTPAGVGSNGGSGANAGDVLFMGCGGGGAGGPNGPGGNGSASGNTAGNGGGGGGAADGGGNGSVPSGSTGGNGGNNFLGSGHGVGGTTTTLAVDGTNGGGGGGGAGSGTGANASNGGTEALWDATHGPGGGGGGGTTAGTVGGNGGQYGGGGGSRVVGIGGNGILVLSWFA